MGPGRCPPASTTAVGTAQCLGKTHEENERKGTVHAAHGLPYGWAHPEEPRRRWNTFSAGPRSHHHGGARQRTVGAVDPPPQGHSVHREETGLFTVCFGLVVPCQANPGPGASCFLRGSRGTSPAGTGWGWGRGSLTRTKEVPRTPRSGWSTHTSLCSVHTRSEAGVTSRWPVDMSAWAHQKLEIWLLSNIGRIL